MHIEMTTEQADETGAQWQLNQRMNSVAGGVQDRTALYGCMIWGRGEADLQAPHLAQAEGEALVRILLRIMASNMRMIHSITAPCAETVSSRPCDAGPVHNKRRRHSRSPPPASRERAGRPMEIEREPPAVRSFFDLHYVVSIDTFKEKVREEHTHCSRLAPTNRESLSASLTHQAGMTSLQLARLAWAEFAHSATTFCSRTLTAKKEKDDDEPCGIYPGCTFLRISQRCA
jgi:hypothetical protein